MLNISNFPWSECLMKDTRVMYQSDSLSLKRSKRNTGVFRYEFELVTYDMPTSEGRGIKAKLSAAVDDTLLFIHPRFSYTQGYEPFVGGILVDDVAVIAGDKEVNLASGAAWELKAGDYIQFGNDTKVYEIADDVPFGAGTKLVKLTSSLRNKPVNGSSVIVNDVTWYLTSNGIIEVSMEASDNQDMQITLVAVEQL